MENKSKKSSNKQLLLAIIGILILISVIICVIVCSLDYTNKNKKEDVAQATIMMNYTSSSNSIVIDSGSPVTVDVGKLLSDTKNVFDFTISSKMTKGSNIKYEIVATKDVSSSTIPDSSIRIYLQKSDSSSYTNVNEVLLPTGYKASDETPIGGANGMILDKGTFDKSSSIYYRLRVWVDSTYPVVDSINYYKLKINVYGKAS